MDSTWIPDGGSLPDVHGQDGSRDGEREEADEEHDAWGMVPAVVLETAAAASTAATRHGHHEVSGGFSSDNDDSNLRTFRLFFRNLYRYEFHIFTFYAFTDVNSFKITCQSFWCVFSGHQWRKMFQKVKTQSWIFF